jgi:hydroxymethyl cephem carbamoyltransferase
VLDVPFTRPGWSARPLDAGALAREVAASAVVAWIEGRADIGPRALGTRSLLASAHRPEITEVLNGLKRREGYRPIAPVCLEEDAGTVFVEDFPDPYMLHFRTVRDRARHGAVAHRDGTARAQTIGPGSRLRLRDLLCATRAVEGAGVLCNTSLSRPGRGFVNRLTDAFALCEDLGIDHLVVDGTWLRRT